MTTTTRKHGLLFGASTAALLMATAAHGQTINGHPQPQSPSADAVTPEQSAPAVPDKTSPASAAPDTGSESQSTPPGDAVSTGDIVVTAQFRTQRLQDTPLAITALNGALLESKGASNILDVANAAPNVTMRQAGGANGGAAQVFIRGVGQADSQFAFEPGVGMYVDDVYYGTVFGSIFDLLDLDRVEVLRGPQGTLSGRNSIGGAVKLFSKKPESGNSGYVEAAYGRFNRLELKGAANFELIPDKLMVRVSGVAKRSDGYFKRFDYGCLNPNSGVQSSASGNCQTGEEGGRNFQAGRLALRIIPSDNVEVNLIGTITSDDSQVAPQKLRDITTRANIPAGIDPRIFIPGAEDRFSYATYISPAFTDPARFNGIPGAGAHPAVALQPNMRLRAKMISGAIDWDLSDDLTLTSITAYQHYTGSNATDIDLTPYGLNTVLSTYRYNQFTQELRLGGSLLDKFLDYTIGAYYFKSVGRFEGANYNLPGLANENIYASNDRIPSESKSVFAHVTANITDRLSLIGGLRYTKDRKDYSFGRLNPFFPNLPSYTSAGQINGVTGSYRGNSVDYRANLQYRWSDQLMTYVQFSTGYRAGGVNPRPYVLDQAVPFDSERLQAYEVGFKADLFGRVLRLNGSLFINEYSDILFNNQSPTLTSVLNSTPVNAGDAQFQGVELEANIRPLDGLLIDASGSYLGFDFKRIGAAGATITGISLDNRAPFAPEWKGNLGMQYEIVTNGKGSVTPRFDISYQSSFFPQVDNDPRARVKGYALVNTRLTWMNDDRDLQVALTISNLLDKYYDISALKYPIGVVSATPAPPREWRLSVRKSF
ncbi:TonB-dependent receptor [Sphingomonas sp. So64.6b]|uniref:TonB-dependent receptor n=1 Tax=Sphingomonas sp. So64.6b TaxID=2997354 RepID=UPI0016037008|nr:TonB-dependent receptor [Sphingomonas sp. So64.6b]QNA82657.1 TonB-dependent receptor [Sphingomonas sp. So64.6b]